MGARPPVRQSSSPDAVRIRLLMKRHKEPAPARPPTPAPQTRAPAWRGLGGFVPGVPLSPRPAGHLGHKARADWVGPGVPRAPPPGPCGRAPVHAPFPGRRARPRPPPAPRCPRPPLTSCVSEAALRRPAGPTGGPLSSAPGPRRPRPSAAGPARLPAQRAQSAAHSAAHSCPPGAILEACDVGTARSPLTHI